VSTWETLTPLLVYIQANLDQDLTLAALGKKANLSPAHLQRVFKAEIGESPKAYVTRLRVERGAFCLLAHESPIGEIAASCGFSEPGDFHSRVPSPLWQSAECIPVSSSGHGRRVG
jgi:AraC family transcriptional regulator